MLSLPFARAPRLLVALVAVTVAVAGCGLSDRDGAGAPDDASQDPPVVDPCHPNLDCFCDPLGPPGEQGCGPSRRCTWNVIQEEPERVGRLVCAPAGPRQQGEPCAFGPPGDVTGFDDCGAGLLCTGGVCTDTCGFGGGASEACAAGELCTRVFGLWANGEDDPLFGQCAPGCNPVTQRRADGTTCGAGNGCYLLVSSTTSVAVCASAGALDHNEPIVGPAFANSCVPGLQPRRTGADGATIECGALCAPADVFVTDPANADGTVRPPAEVTNAQHEGGRAPFTCVARGAPAVDAPDGESCRYWWAREPFSERSPFSDTVGWCFPHERRGDLDGDGQLDPPFLRCAALAADDARTSWCMTKPAMMLAAPAGPAAGARPAAVALDRLAP